MFNAEIKSGESHVQKYATCDFAIRKQLMLSELHSIGEDNSKHILGNILFEVLISQNAMVGYVTSRLSEYFKLRNDPCAYIFSCLIEF